MIAALGGARIGPNAITQLAGALEREQGRDYVRQLLGTIGLEPYADSPPGDMVDEAEVIALHRAVRERLPELKAQSVAWRAGVQTAEYLLARRIPRAAQAVLRPLPAGLASRLLLAAIRRHAWTFAGSGRFTAHAGRTVLLSIEDCPICRGAHAAHGVCDYYAATFSRLYKVLVHPAARVREIECAAAGAPACRFEISWRALPRSRPGPL
jgi:divinyl protochlorophyllide a 8-vinyl-reductase